MTWWFVCESGLQDRLGVLFMNIILYVQFLAIAWLFSTNTLTDVPQVPPLPCSFEPPWPARWTEFVSPVLSMMKFWICLNGSETFWDLHLLLQIGHLFFEPCNKKAGIKLLAVSKHIQGPWWPIHAAYFSILSSFSNWINVFIASLGPHSPERCW